MQISGEKSGCSVCGMDLAKIPDEAFTKMMMMTNFQVTPLTVAVSHKCGKCGKKFCWGCTAESMAKCPHCGSGIKQDV